MTSEPDGRDVQARTKLTRQAMSLGPQRLSAPSGAASENTRPDMKLRLTPEQDAAIRLAWKAQNDGAQRTGGVRLTLTAYVWGLFEAHQRAATGETQKVTPTFLDLTPLAGAIGDHAQACDNVRCDLGKALGILKSTFAVHADAGPAMRAAIGEAIGSVRAAIAAADALCVAQSDAVAELRMELRDAAMRIARYAR